MHYLQNTDSQCGLGYSQHVVNDACQTYALEY